MNKFDLTRVPKQWAVALCALLFAALLAGSGCSAPAADSTDNGSAPAEASQAQTADDGAQAPAGTIAVEVNIDMPNNGLAESKAIGVDVPEGATAYDALVKSGVDVQAENSDYGKFVTSIDGVQNGSEGEASGWTYKVNDESPTVGCDSYVLKNGDVITWEFYIG